MYIYVCVCVCVSGGKRARGQAASCKLQARGLAVGWQPAQVFHDQSIDIYIIRTCVSV